MPQSGMQPGMESWKGGASMQVVATSMQVRGGAPSSSKSCIHPGCTKGAIGKLRLCIAHGGGKRCTVAGCNKAAQGQKPLCKAHGGGRRCKYPDCPRSARLGCTTSARSGTPYCSLHDGLMKKQGLSP